MTWRSTLRPSSYVVASPPARVDARGVCRVVLSTRTGVRLLVDEDSWSALEAGRIEALEEAFIPALVEAGLLVDSSANEVDEVLAENLSAIDTADVLDYVVQPTAACQLGCGYCGQHHVPTVMDTQTQDLTVARLAERLRTRRESKRPYAKVNVGWFGAEPLLGLAAIRRLTPLLRSAVEAEGASLSAHIVTNGLSLTPAVAQELAGPLDVSHVDVTLDGPPAIHDRRRHTKSGHPTFHQIWENLLAIAADETVRFELTLRCNVDATNASFVPELINLIASSELASRARLYFSPVYAWGNDADKVALDAKDYAEQEVAWMAMQIARGMPVQLVPSRREIVCVAVQADARVVDAYGSEYTCTEVPYVPTYGTPNMYETGTVGVTLRNSKPPQEPLPFQSFNEEIARGAVGCTSCELLPICGGACPKSWHDGRVPCPSHKFNLPDRLLLEVAQRRLARAPSE